ncbi:MAG: arginine repressor [Clostridia bacterium]|nr:arginine repressor [Clostridia bacterium]
MKFQRQAAIVDLIERKEIKTQEQLSEELKNEGFNATQATISRDIKELRLVKVSSETGGYKYSTPEQNNDALHMPRLRNIFRECVIKVDRAQNLVLLKTLVGMGNAACAAIDAMRIDDIVGTLAGDDTILIIMRDNSDAEKLCDAVRELLV